MRLLITICVNFLKLSVEKLDFKPLWDNKLIDMYVSAITKLWINLPLISHPSSQEMASQVAA